MSSSAKGRVVTRKEALRLFGLREGALASLEKEAKLGRPGAREGYTERELKALMAGLKRILSR